MAVAAAAVCEGAVGGRYGEPRRRDFFVRHLLGVEPTDRNEAGDAPG